MPRGVGYSSHRGLLFAHVTRGSTADPGTVDSGLRFRLSLGPSGSPWLQLRIDRLLEVCDNMQRHAGGVHPRHLFFDEARLAYRGRLSCLIGGKGTARSGGRKRDRWQMRCPRYHRYGCFGCCCGYWSGARPHRGQGMRQDYLLEQYKLMASSFNQEITRFWTRFHILVGFEIGGFIAILASSKVLILNPCLFRVALMAMTFLSLGAAVIVWRGFLMHQTLLRVMAELEKRSDGKLYTLRISGQVSSMPIGLNQIIAIVIATTLALCWIVLWVYAEFIGFGFVAPD